MDFESSNNLLWDQNIIAHNLEYNINAELQRGQPRGRPRGQPRGRPHRETFVGARQCQASRPADRPASQPTRQPDSQPDNQPDMFDSLAANINRDLTDVFGKNWQLLFLIIAIAVCVIQYVHYRHVTGNLVEIIKLFMCQESEREFNASKGLISEPVIQPVKLPSGVNLMINPRPGQTTTQSATQPATQSASHSVAVKSELL